MKIFHLTFNDDRHRCSILKNIWMNLA